MVLALLKSDVQNIGSFSLFVTLSQRLKNFSPNIFQRSVCFDLRPVLCIIAGLNKKKIRPLVLCRLEIGAFSHF